MIVIGIDPGKSGSIAILGDGWFYVFPIPLAGDEIDMATIYGNLRSVIGPKTLDKTVVAYIEKVGAMPGQGVSSMFSFGFTTGALHGIVASFGIPRYMVTPQAWKKVILAGTAKDKNAAIEYCRRVHPNISLLPTDRSKVCHNGMADAICIAEYGRTRHENI